MHQLWESRTGGEYFKLCKILTEFPGMFREYYRMNITFDYILDSVKDDLQVFLISESALKQKRNSSVRTGYCGKDKNKLHLQNVTCYDNSV
jgi:hypothetical protein